MPRYIKRWICTCYIGRVELIVALAISALALFNAWIEEEACTLHVQANDAPYAQEQKQTRRDDSLPQTLTNTSLTAFAHLSTSFRLIAPLTHTFKLGSGSNASWPLNRLARVISTSCLLRHSSTTSCSSRSSASIVAGGLSRKMCTSAEVGCEGM